MEFAAGVPSPREVIDGVIGVVGAVCGLKVIELGALKVAASVPVVVKLMVCWDPSVVRS